MQEFEIEFEIKPTEFEIDMSNVIRELTPPLINLEVDPTNKKQVFNHNGEYGYDEVIVNPISSEYIKPTGTLDITANGEYDVTDYAKANVKVGEVEKGLIINAFDSNGYPIEVTFVGMTVVPYKYFSCENSSTFFGKTNKINLPDNITEIYNNAFQNCSSLTSIELPDRTTSIGSYVFSGCSNLTSIKLSNSLTSLGSSAFSNCTKLVSIELPDGLTSIGSSAFNYCSKLTSIELPDGVTTIGSYVFSGCSNLASIRLLGELTSIDYYAFYNCNKLTTFILENVTSVVQLISTYAFKNTPIEKGTGYIYVPDNLVESFKSATNWSTYANQIKGLSELEA